MLGLADSPACQTHSVLSECYSRQSITLQASVHGVVDQPSSFRADLGSPPHAVNRPICDFSQCATPGLSNSLPQHEHEGDRCTIPLMGFSRGVVRRLSPYPAANSGPRGDSSDFASSSVVCPAVVQLHCGAVSKARGTSPA